jgi:hypothetical protein
METLFVFDKRNYQDCQNAYRGPRNREYYSGDYTIEPGSVIDVRADRKAMGACLHHPPALQDQAVLPALPGPTSARMPPTSRCCGSSSAAGSVLLAFRAARAWPMPGDFVITKSMTPFSVECLPDENSVHEVLHVIGADAHAARRCCR